MIKLNSDKEFLKLQSDKIKVLKEARDEACEEGITYSGKVFKIDDKSTHNVSLKRSCYNVDRRYKFSDKNHRIVDFENAQTFEDFYNAVFERKDYIMFHYNTLYAAIDDAENPADLDNIVIDFSEPE
jgi:hypothetical protein